MNFSQLQSFVALAEMGSFTEAAYTVNLTQSAVSHALAALENELGVTLLERNRTGVVALTNVGEKIIPHVRALLAQAEAIEQEAKAAHGETSGKLRLGSILSIISPSLLASVLTRFRASYPDMEVVLFEGAMHEVGEWIESSIIDVGFVVLPAPGIVRYQASDSATILAMVREGLGITLVPRMMLPKKLEGVVALPLDPPQPLRIGLAVRSQKMASPGARLFVQTALTCTQEQASLLARAR